MKFAALTVLIHILGMGFGAQALLTTSTLPEGINSPSFRYSIVDKVGERYVEDGSLMRLGDLKSMVFDTETLLSLRPDAQRLIDALNSFGHHGLGDKFNFGVLRIETIPQIKYFAPIFARGMTEKWTVGFGLPLVSYQNKITIRQEFSNLDYYREQFSGLSPELDEALNLDLASATNEVLLSKGYKPLVNREEKFMGDAQLVSIYKFFETPQSAMIYQALISLPTGPRYDSDDLASLNIFGRTSVNNTFAYARNLGTRYTVMPFASLLLNLPDQITARVPENEADGFPDVRSKEKVSRHIGETATLGTNVFYDITDKWVAGVSYEFSHKVADRFAGSTSARYDLLEKDTQGNAQRVKAEITYSTIDSYFDKKSLIPLMVSYEVADVVAGINVERRFSQELNLLLFF